MSCVEAKNGRHTGMHKLGERQHKSIPGHRGFVRPGKVVVQHNGTPSVGTSAGPTLAQVSAAGTTPTQVQPGGQ